MTDPVIYTCDHHSAVYDHLEATGAREVAMTHLDAHCDMKGLIVDPEAGRAWLRNPELRLSTSTFLSLAVARGLVAQVEWVHDEVGGRCNDLGTVLLADDLDRLPYRWQRRPTGAGVPMRYGEVDFGDWRHRDAHRILDIDWDFFADPRKTPARRDAEVRTMLADRVEAVPLVTYVAYSPYYSAGERAEYDAFVEALSARFAARVERLPERIEITSKTLARRIPMPVRRLLRRHALRLKRWTLGERAS